MSVPRHASAYMQCVLITKSIYYFFSQLSMLSDDVTELQSRSSWTAADCGSFWFSFFFSSTYGSFRLCFWVFTITSPGLTLYPFEFSPFRSNPIVRVICSVLVLSTRDWFYILPPIYIVLPLIVDLVDNFPHYNNLLRYVTYITASDLLKFCNQRIIHMLVT